MPSRLSERSSARSFFSPSTGSRPAPQHLSQVLTHAQTRRRRTSASADARARARGFTLIETAISGIVVAGITASLLLAVRYSQMVSEGKAVGQQMSAISEGANRYMKQYSQQILALDARCAESTLEIDEGGAKPSGPTGTEPDCKLVLGSVTVANGFQPTVKELQDLELVRANDALMLPFSPGITRDKRTGEAAVARIAVAIRPVRHQLAASNPSSSSGAGTSIPAGFVPGMNVSLGGQTLTFNGFAYRLGTDTDRDMPPTINGVSCYNGIVDNAAKHAWGAKEMIAGSVVFVDAKDDLKVLPIYTQADALAANSDGGVYYRGLAKSFMNGKAYCRYLQQRYGMGIVTAAGNGTGSSGPGAGNGNGNGNGNAYTLESVVFNTQPYYFGANSLPMGAAAQLGAALQEAGYAGRMSPLKAGMAESKTLRGLFGHSQAENPIQSRDGARGLPGVLAAVNLLADNAQAASAAGGPAPGWDAVGGNITSAGLIQAKQISTGSAVFGDKGEVINTQGRDATLAVHGNMVMGQNSVLMAASVEASGVDAGVAKAQSVEAGEYLSTPGIQVAGASSRIGRWDNKPYNFYFRNGTNVRLPRVEMGKPCPTYGDIGVSKGLSIQKPGGILYEATRFIAVCKPIFIADTQIGLVAKGSSLPFRASTWSSPEYEAMLKKYPATGYQWVWFESSEADQPDTEPTL